MLERPISKAGWTRVAFGDVVRLSKARVADPEAAGIERVVGLEHIEPGDLRIRRWGDVADGTTFTTLFKPGQVLFGKRRAYQRKVALADFEGVCSGDIYVLEPANDRLMPELLPFLCQTDAFFDHAIGTSAGSLSPRTNWTSLASFEFLLPPIQEQARLVEALTGIEAALECHRNALIAGEKTLGALQREMVAANHSAQRVTLADLCEPGAPLCYGVVQPGDNEMEGVPLIRVCDIEAEQIDRSQLKRIATDINQNYRRSRVRSGDVLISIVGTIGRIYVANDEDTGANIARAIARVRPSSRMKAEFLANVLRSPEYQELLDAAAFESARKTLNLDALGAVRIPVPAISIQEQWLSAISSIKHRLNEARIRTEALRGIGATVLNLENEVNA